MRREDAAVNGQGAGATSTFVPEADATQRVQELAAGRLSSRDLLEEQVRRVEAHNPAINAVVAMNLDDARRQADLADAAIRRGETLGALHGLSMTLKDTWEIPGMPCVAGAPEFRGHMPRTSAVAVQRLLGAGAIVYGKTNVPYMASDIQSFNPVYGTTRHPSNPSLTPGGSSGGAAAALAAGFTTLELGSDLAGSIRIPAHYCHVHGHKSTYGVICG
jgi:amidase